MVKAQIILEAIEIYFLVKIYQLWKKGLVNYYTNITVREIVDVDLVL